MSTSKALLAVLIVGVVATGGANSVRAASDGMIERGAPHWLDQTVYRPDCPKTERGRDWHTDRVCDMAPLPCR